MVTPLFFCPLKSNDGFILPQIGIGSIGVSLSLIFFIYNGILPLSSTVGSALLYFVYIACTNAWSTVQHNSLRDMPLIFLSVGRLGCAETKGAAASPPSGHLHNRAKNQLVKLVVGLLAGEDVLCLPGAC